MQPGARKPEVERVIREVSKTGLHPHVSVGKERKLILVIGDERKLNLEHIQALSGVENVHAILKPYKMASREFHPENTVIKVKNAEIGGNNIVFMAGPCAIESEKQIIGIAEKVKKAGCQILRGGAFKPRTSPYAFQGLGEKGLKYLHKAGRETGLAVITEVMDTAELDLVARYADILQLGTRNMQNYKLLKACGRIDKPVLLKRGMSALFDEFLMSAEYIMSEGNYNVILCERGIRTFVEYTRNTLDLNIVPVLKETTHLPVIVDVSHGTGLRKIVRPMARAAIAAGADGVMIEAHTDPEKSVSDAAQTVDIAELIRIVAETREIAALLGRG
jgi:3-deoxy-7-phosphoheptulonate synthase